MGPWDRWNLGTDGTLASRTSSELFYRSPARPGPTAELDLNFFLDRRPAQQLAPSLAASTGLGSRAGPGSIFRKLASPARRCRESLRRRILGGFRGDMSSEGDPEARSNSAETLPSSAKLLSRAFRTLASADFFAVLFCIIFQCLFKTPQEASKTAQDAAKTATKRSKTPREASKN